MKKYVVTIIMFFITILLPVVILLLNLSFPSLNILNRRQLWGVEREHSFPDFTFHNIKSGYFQNEFSAWWSVYYGGRSYVSSAYSQIGYSFFRVTRDPNTIIGREKEFFRMDDTNSFLALDCDYRDQERANQMSEYVSHLKSLSDKLRNNNKFLLLYLTPDKSDFLRNHIPEKYYWRADTNAVNAADCLVKKLEETDINYIDTRELLKEYEYPVYYITGAHWSAIAEQEMTVNLLRTIENISHKKIKKMTLGKVLSQNEPYFRDNDAFITQNLFFARTDPEYYCYEESVDDSGKETLNILIQGGSYCAGFINDIVNNDVLNGGKMEFVSYNHDVTLYENDKGSEVIANLDGSFSNYDFNSCVDYVNGIIIELNSGSGINGFSSGFVEYLDGIIE